MADRRTGRSQQRGQLLRRSAQHRLTQYRLTPYGSRLDIAIRRLLIHAIGFYQRRLSPHKRFSCAYRVLHGTHSCSQGIKEILQTNTLPKAYPLIRQQFSQCRQALKIIHDRRTYCPQCNHLATPENVLYPSLGDRIFATRRGDPGYGRSSDGGEDESRRNNRQRRDNTGATPYNSWCDCNICYCADFEPPMDSSECGCCDGPGDCDSSCFACDGCDACVCDCA